MLNSMGINPFEWFQSEKKEPPSWEDTAPSEYEPPMTETDWFIEKPDESDEIEEEKTMHQKMYEMATKNGGSEQIQLPPRPEEEVYDDFNNTI